MEDFLNRYSSGTFERTIVSPQSSTFGETVGAMVGLRLAPIYENIGISTRFNLTPVDPSFDWRENLGEYAEYAPALSAARNPAHMAALKAMIDRSHERRFVLANASLGTNLAAGLFDPVNYIALPLGGPALGVARSAIRVGAGTALVEGTAQAISLKLDPVQTIEEATANTVTTALFGAALGGAISIPSSGRAVARDATNAANAEIMRTANRIGNIEGLTLQEIENAAPRAERPLAEVDNVELQSRVNSFEARATQADSIGNTQAASDLRTEAMSFRNEIGIREIEDMDIDFKDPYNIKSSWFTDSVFYQFVPTPMKRTLQGDYPSEVKEIFLRSFGDNGILTSLASIGLPSPQSVAIRSAVRQGQWVRANDELTKIWASETNASPASRLDINLSDAARTLARSDDTFRSWRTSVNKRRILGDTNVSDAELRAADIIAKYFEEGGARLEDRGLLGTAKGMDRQIEMLEAEIASLRSSLTGVRLKSPERNMVEGRVKKLEGRIRRAGRTSDRPDGPEPREPFNPRFFDKPAIRKDRDGFYQILYKWFEEHPFIYRLDEAGNPTKVELSVIPEDISARVNKTIDGILGETDPADLDNLSFGSGRSTHFRSRQLDIPNSLVVDFMITDPLAVMKAYASRVEPRFEFSDMFGKNLDSVLFDIERSMVSAGKSQRKIDKVMRDYKHMYSRTVGSVLENPDALSIRAGNFLKQAATYSYLGGAGLAAIPDFGRIIMEYDLDNVWKGVQGLADRTRVDMLANEVRMAGEGLDIIKGSAHMRFTEDLTNSIDTDIFNQIQSAFHIFNGLGPLTTIAKQLAGVVDGHQIIDYSIKLSKGKLGPQDTTWLLKHGIGEDMARLIAKAPYERSETGLYHPNTDAWASDEFLSSVLDQSFTYNRPKVPFSQLSQRQLTNHFSKEFPEVAIYTDPKIVKPYFSKLQQKHGYRSLLGFMTDMRDIPDGGFSVHIDKDMVRDRYERIKNNTSDISLDRVSRQQIMDDIESGTIRSDLLFHVTNDARGIVEKGFVSGGGTIGEVVSDMGYGDFVTVFDLRETFARMEGDQEFLDEFGLEPNEVRDFVQKSVYTGAEQIFSDSSSRLGTTSDPRYNIIGGKTPTAVFHISELPNLRAKRFEGARSQELGDATGLSKMEDEGFRLYRSGELTRENYQDNTSSIPPSLQDYVPREELLEGPDGVPFTPEELAMSSEDILFEDLDKIIRREDEQANFAKSYTPIDDEIAQATRRNADQVKVDVEQAFADGKISEEYFHHINNELDAINLFETADDYLEYVMLHELHHSVINRNVGESTASLENRIDQAAIAYMRDQRGSGEKLAREQAMSSLRAEQEEAVMQFRAALNSGVLNTIMSGTPADKPIITDGVVYIPMSVASKFGMKEHPNYKGYARIENGFLGFPFQFYSFVLANLNKTVGSLAQGTVKNRAIGATTMLGLGYMVLQYRTPDYIWDEMSPQDKFARTFDMSGIAALYSDLFYLSMHTSLALGGPNITNGFLSPKFNQQQNLADAITGIAGAGPSWGLEMGRGMVNFASGNFGEGGKDIVRNLPFARMWFWKDEMNQITNAIAN